MKNDKELIISLSGVRGIWQDSFTKKDVIKLCLAAGKIFKDLGKNTLVLARDTRKSSPGITALAKTCFKKQRFKTIDLGIIPTPTLQTFVANDRESVGLMITASHNPPQYNGLKFINNNGMIFDQKQSEKLHRLFTTNKAISIKEVQNNSLNKREPKAIENHFSKIFKTINVSKIQKRHFKVIVDPGNGAASNIDKEFLQKLGCQVWQINGTINGIFSRKIEPAAKNLKVLQKKVLEKKADLGFAQDGDGDRLVVIDQKGNFISPNKMLSLVISHFLTHKRHPNKKVVVNLATTKTIDNLVKKAKGELVKTPVGEINVVKKAISLNALIAGESCGGVICAKICPGRDSFTAMANILELLAINNKKMTISEASEKLPNYYLVEEKIDKIRKPEKLFQFLEQINWGEKIVSTDKRDGIRIDFKDSWVLTRSSNTESILRIIAESKTKQKSIELIDKIKSYMLLFQK